MSLDYREATPQEILAFAGHLPGRTLGDIGTFFEVAHPVRGKSEVGLALKSYFGIPRNARSEADFPGAGIELKAVPVRRTRNGTAVKERTVVSMIDFASIVEETWASAKVRGKLFILFVYFEHMRESPKSEYPVLDVLLWRPIEANE